MRGTVGDILGLRGVWWEDDFLHSSSEVGGDPFEGISLDSYLVKPVDQGVM